MNCLTGEGGLKVLHWLDRPLNELFDWGPRTKRPTLVREIYWLVVWQGGSGSSGAVPWLESPPLNDWGARTQSHTLARETTASLVRLGSSECRDQTLTLAREPAG